MISLDSAVRLRAAGLEWHPAPGDRFVVDKPELLATPFVLSDMTIDVHDYPTGRVFGFNGTTEWALDSVEMSETVWLPSEHQLREHLGWAFRSLTWTGVHYRVVLDVDAQELSFAADDPAEAYASALLHVLGARADA